MCRLSPGEGRGANEKLKLISHLTHARRSIPEATSETVSPGPELRLAEPDLRACRHRNPKALPTTSEGRASCAKHAARAAVDVPNYTRSGTRSRQFARTGRVRAPAPAAPGQPGAGPQSVGHSGGPHPVERRPPLHCPWRSKPGPQQVPAAPAPRKDPASRRRARRRSDHLPHLRLDLFKARPSVPVGLGLCILERLHESCAFGFQPAHQANAGRNDFADITVTPSGNRFSSELLEIGRQGDAVHAGNIGQGRAAGKDFAQSAFRASGREVCHG